MTLHAHDKYLQYTEALQVTDAAFHPSIHSSIFPSIQSVNIAATWNRIKASFFQSWSITTISSITGFVVLRGWLFLPLTSYTDSCIHAHHSCCFISGAEHNPLGQGHVQPQLQIDHLSSLVASASFPTSAHNMFLLSYCSYCHSLNNKGATLEESQETFWAEIQECLFVNILLFLYPHFLLIIILDHSLFRCCHG